MNNQLDKWQQAYQQATPQVDTEALLVKTRKSYKRGNIKAIMDLGLGLLVSAFCLYALFVYADSLPLKLLFGALAPIPFGFSLWAYKQRGVLQATQSLDVQALLTFNKAQLLQKLQYWKVSALVMSILWIGVCGVLMFQVINIQSIDIWVTILLVQSPIVLGTLVRFWLLKRSTPVQICKIASLMDAI